MKDKDPWLNDIQHDIFRLLVYVSTLIIEAALIIGIYAIFKEVIDLIG